MLPARIDELERVRLLIELRRAEHVVNQLRQLLTEEEAEQLDLQRRVEQRVGRLRAEVERVQREADRLELRLAQLATARRPLTDEEKASIRDYAARYVKYRLDYLDQDQASGRGSL